MIAPPSRGKPQNPKNEEQVDPGPIVDPPVFPAMGRLEKTKVMPGKFGGRIQRVGKK